MQSSNGKLQEIKTPEILRIEWECNEEETATIYGEGSTSRIIVDFADFPAALNALEDLEEATSSTKVSGGVGQST